MKDGLIEEFYDNGQLERKGNYKDRKREGPWEWYYENGQLEERENYKNGIWNGSWEYFDEKGKLVESEKLTTIKTKRDLCNQRKSELEQ